jgi:hypothetical protein
MTSHHTSSEVSQLLQALAVVPGLEALSVITKTFPHLGPAELGTGYRQSVLRFQPESVPTVVPIDPDAEEINIAGRGALSDERHRHQLVQQLRTSVSAAGAAWDFRVHFPAGLGGGVKYELNVFAT